jgi:hypothetical protein
MGTWKENVIIKLAKKCKENRPLNVLRCVVRKEINVCGIKARAPRVRIALRVLILEVRLF